MAQLESREIGQRIAQARKEVGGMTQDELSDLLGVTTRSVQGYEAGDVIPYRHFERLGEIFIRSLDWFLHGEVEAETDRLAAIEAEIHQVRHQLEAVLDALDAPPEPNHEPAGTTS